MRLFKFLKSLTAKSTKPHSWDAEQADSSKAEDYLSLATDAKQAAEAAVKSGDFDEAWRLLHKVQYNYARYASVSRFTASQLLALDGSVREDLANVLRLEGRDDDALAEIIYWVASGSESVERHDQKLQAYLKRSSLDNVQLEDVKAFLSSVEVNPDFSVIRDKMTDWANGLGAETRCAQESVKPLSTEATETLSPNEDPVTSAHQLIRVLAEAEPLSQSELKRLWREQQEANKIDFVKIELMKPDAREEYIAELETEMTRRQNELENTPSARVWAKASDDRSNDLV